MSQKPRIRLPNDPKVLLTYVAQALDEIEPIDRRVFAALASPGSSVPGSGHLETGDLTHQAGQ